MRKQRYCHNKEKNCYNLSQQKEELAINKRKWNYLESEPAYHTTKFFTEYLLPVEMKKKRDIYD